MHQPIMEHNTMMPRLLLLLSTITLSANEVVFIVHGTWAKKRTFSESWFKPGGYFFDTVEKEAQKHNAHVVPFLWSGENNHQARVSAGRTFAKLIQSYPRDTYFTIIAHSHGVNVVFLAAQELAQDKKNSYHIHVLYALGAPIHNKQYQPDMSVIDYCYNFYSYEDFIQPVFGLFEREINTHCRIANIRITIEEKDPGHCELHHSNVAKWIYYIHDMLCPTDFFEFTDPGVIHFYKNKPPVYLKDQIRNELREIDKISPNHLLLNTFRSTLKQLESKKKPI